MVCSHTSGIWEAHIWSCGCPPAKKSPPVVPRNCVGPHLKIHGSSKVVCNRGRNAPGADAATGLSDGTFSPGTLTCRDGTVLISGKKVGGTKKMCANAIAIQQCLGQGVIPAKWQLNTAHCFSGQESGILCVFCDILFCMHGL